MGVVSRVIVSCVAFGLLAGCAGEEAPASSATSDATTNAASTTPTFSIDIEKFTLDNGLEVILHVDKSDPVVAIALGAHVGSSRELPGRTGFAHLFEHLLFLDSENLGYGGLDEMNTRIGGEGTNGFTTNDLTLYFQATPADTLEKIIWAEADKLGFFINTVTQAVVDNEKQVVKNEKRQRVDNQPFGHAYYVIGKALYPEDHPYNWQVIGSLADLDAATLQDVKDFYRRWYVPNNVTVTIAGDFDPAEAKRLVEKYFGEIPRGEPVKPIAPRAATLEATKSLYHEDNFATVPLIAMVWPGVELYHPDSYALSILADYLSEGKRAPLNEVLIDEKKLTSGVSVYSNASEIAGEVFLTIAANAGEDLDNLAPAIAEGFTRFEQNGISQADLDRIKAGLEAAIYGEVQSALGKAIQLNEYNMLAGDAGFLTKDVEKILSVTTDDVMRVYNTYIKDKPYVATSFVPKGAPELALEGAVKAEVVEEPIVAGAEAETDFDPTVRDFDRTPTAFDRTQEPPFGAPYELPAPTIWRAALGDGFNVIGIENDEVPLVEFSLAIEAGRARGSAEKPAIAALTADMLSKGTAEKTTAELEDAIGALGSSISVSAGQQYTYVSGQSLARNFAETIALVEEMLLTPRWDAEEFDLLKRRRLNEIDQQAGNPDAIAARESAKLLYPEDHVLSYTSYGTKEKLEAVALEDLKAFHASFYAPAGATLRIVGDVDAEGVKAAFAGLSSKWTVQAPPSSVLPQANSVDASAVYFYDAPGSKQSILRIERPSLSATEADYPLAQAVNFLLGGIYTSKLNTELRVNRGYTYGIGSRFRGTVDRGVFFVRSSVRSNITLEAMTLIRDILKDYGPSFTEQELEVMKAALLRGQALETETLDAKLSMLAQISAYDYPDDFRKQNAARIEAMSLEDFRAIAAKYINPEAMNWLVVGDAESQASRLEALGFGAPVMLNAPAAAKDAGEGTDE